MRGVSAAPGDFVHFKSQVPLHRIPIGLKQWRYYDFGPKLVPPLICIPGITGTADVYYKQVMSLSMKGYRVISVDIPRVWNHVEWIQAFEKFLDAIDVHHVHLYGTSLGGFLAQLFAQHRPRRVRSLMLSNAFLDTSKFSAAMPWAPIVESLSRDDLASRLTLNVDPASVGSLLLPDSSITIMDTNDFCAIPQPLKDQLSERYPGARRALLKSGGDFPFLSRPDEVNLHLQLHLRRVGVEARPDLVRGFTGRTTDNSGPSNEKALEDHADDPSNVSGDSIAEIMVPGNPSVVESDHSGDHQPNTASISLLDET